MLIVKALKKEEEDVCRKHLLISWVFGGCVVFLLLRLLLCYSYSFLVGAKK